MNKEEKQAIEYLKRHIIPVYARKGNIEYMLNNVILNLIDKQQKKIEENKKFIQELIETNHNWVDENVKKAEVIDKMAYYIAKKEVEEVNKQTIRIKELWNKVTPEKPIWDLIKEYFFKEIENEN